MLHLLPVISPWYITGPLFGLCVVALYALVNRHLGVSGSYVQFLDAARGRPIESWRLWFLAGLLLGGAVETVIGTAGQTGMSYGLLGRLLPLAALIPVLLVGRD